jgi:flagellar operon protein
LENRIVSGLNQAESKGSREALILADNVAVIANVKSRTIVTAMDRGQMKERIFTNIDSAVLV